MLIGDRSIFAIESEIHDIFKPHEPSHDALGYFVVHVNSFGYGVRSKDATMLRVPLSSIRERISRRGSHIAPFSDLSDGRKLAGHLMTALYTFETQSFFGLSSSDVTNIINHNRISWDGDTDEAFDDDSHIFHFDVEDRVRIIACKDPQGGEFVFNEAWMSAQYFYSILETWHAEFTEEWSRKEGEFSK